ncbi:hypothetical protein WS67_18580 [Burkholderia singularis]|uniref:Uncharacterized protein n=1 Tax=Burkholderia singularis TaxID=1503053 RepID=A0A118DMQ7_9BURK|nr:hypothetical protein WS67_18580 [Burkholderia singularis]
MYRRRAVVSLPFPGDLPPPPSFDDIRYPVRPGIQLTAARANGAEDGWSRRAKPAAVTKCCGENETFFAKRVATKSARAVGNKKAARAKRMTSTFFGW